MSAEGVRGVRPDVTARGLSALDTTNSRGLVYTALVAHPRSTVAQLSASVAMAESELHAVLADLEAAGLVDCVLDGTVPGWEARPPERALEVALREEADSVARQAQRLSKAREASQMLSRLHWMARRSSGPYPGIEVIHDPVQVREEFRAMLGGATREVCTVVRPPLFASESAEETATQVSSQEQAMRAGVRFRTIWWEGVFEDRAIGQAMLTTLAMGEQSRILSDPPMKAVIVDGDRAMLVHDPHDPADGATLVISRSGLLTTMIGVFDALWRQATPVAERGGSELDEQERAILALMAAGATDETIARQLGVSRRTVTRHLTTLFERLGVTTRFQAGVQASQRGWLGCRP
jgi:DNA-binding CsgD family transcriptional regulator